MYEADETDAKILRELSKDSRASFRKLARSLGIATTTAISKYRRMKEEGIIKNSSIIIDYEKIGYNLTALIELRVSKGKLTEVENNLAHKHNVYAVYDITGADDAVILARFRDRKELNIFVKSLLSMEFIERTNTHLVLNIVKENYSLV